MSAPGLPAAWGLGVDSVRLRPSSVPSTIPPLKGGAESFEAKPVLAPPPRGNPELEDDLESDDAPSTPQLEPAAVPADPGLPLAASAAVSAADERGDEPMAADDDGPVHRPLMR